MTLMQPNLSDLPEYLCHKIDVDLRFTGNLLDPHWQLAPPLHLVNAITGQPGRFKTEVRLLYNPRYLYVLFRCEDDYIWGTVTERDGPIYDEECVEVFVNPAQTSFQYYEINVSPKNVVFDACLLNSRTPTQNENPFLSLYQWNLKDLQTSVQVVGNLDQPGQGREWIVQFAIPLAELWGAPHLPPQPGDVWRVNFYRIDSPSKDQREHYAWQKIGKAVFHVPWMFGYLRFSD
jgi:hypothetical protein